MSLHLVIQNQSEFIISHTLPEFDDHQMVSTLFDQATEMTAIVAIHRGGVQRPAFGATRLWSYPDMIHAYRDVLKLSQIMSYKSALAGLPYGGAKAVILAPATISSRSTYLRSYAKKVSLLAGHFITGADVGVSQADVKNMARVAPNMVGAHVDPVYWTIQGAVEALEIVCLQLFGRRSFVGRSFAIQGLGKTGMGLLHAVYPQAAKIYVADINPHAIETVKKTYPRACIVESGSIHKQSVDVFSPCALSGVLTERVVYELRCAAVAGIANGQLHHAEIGKLLHKRSILYAPDYVVNAGGLISVVSEYENRHPNKKTLASAVGRIGKTLQELIQKSNRIGHALSDVADELAMQRIAHMK